MDKHKLAALCISLGAAAVPVVMKFYGSNATVAFLITLASSALTVLGTNLVKPTVGQGSQEQPK